jgi:imidazolonepropionase-like amidohydrolase
MALAAQACGLAVDTGRLAKGYAADVLVVADDLSQDVTLLSTPLAVLVRGTRVELAK